MRRQLLFCRTCNARERVVENGKCVVCGNDPFRHGIERSARDITTDPPRMFTREMVDAATDPPTDGHVDWPEWTWLDKYVLVLCVVATLYVLWHVVRWML